MKYLIALALLWSCCASLYAQDPQYTQFYANPLYLNPAFAGATGDGRVSANYRYQWPNLDVNYITYSVSYDQFISKYRSGIGFMVNQDQIKTKNDFTSLAGKGTPIQTTSISGIYSYVAQLSDRYVFQAGLQASQHVRTLTKNFVFEEDILTGSNSEVFPSGTSNNFLDFNAGGLFYSENLWVGITASHLNQPNQSILESVGGIDKLPMKMAFQLGYRFDLANRNSSSYNAADVSITPTILYRMQGKADQLDAGIYATYEPVTFGVWYRGIPFKKLQDTDNINSPGIATSFRSNDALALMLGFKREQFSFVYSYDVTVSSLNQVNTGGSHELSITYNLTTNYDHARNRPRYKSLGRIYCPNPWKTRQKLKKGK